MTLDSIKDMLEENIVECEKQYARTLEKFGERDVIANWHEGRLSAYKNILKFIENN